MKSIQFHNSCAQWYYVPVLVFSVSLLVYVIVTSGQGQYASECLTVSLLLSSLLLIRKIWYKTYVQYTNIRILIRINRFSELSIKFDDLTDIEYIKDQLILNGNTTSHILNVEDVNPKDIQKLVDIMAKRSEAFYNDSSNLSYYE